MTLATPSVPILEGKAAKRFIKKANDNLAKGGSKKAGTIPKISKKAKLK